MTIGAKSTSRFIKAALSFSVTLSLAQLIAGTVDAYNASHGISANDAVAALDKCAELIIMHREDWPVPGSNVIKFPGRPGAEDFVVREPLTNPQLVC
jgi:hypothetical protein